MIESRNEVIRLAVDPLEGTIDLHAAVVVCNGRALLLMGEAWAGKTTIALELIKRGWDYFSDDLAVIDRASLDVRPVPKPPGVKAHPWATMNHHWGAEAKELGVPPGPFLIPPPFRGVLSARATPAWIVLLDYEEDHPAELTGVTKAKGTAKAGEFLGRIEKDSFRALVEVGRRCQHLKLTYGRADEAVEKLVRFLPCEDR